jgi:calcium-dependent protein kinase
MEQLTIFFFHWSFHGPYLELFTKYNRYTMAPEVLKGSYTNQADLWSVGVIAAMLLSSQMPFFGHKRSQLVEQIMQGKFELKGKRWKRVSRQAKSFVSALLVVDPSERATAEEALQYHWLNRYFNMTTRNINKSVEDGKVEELDVNELDKVQGSLMRYAEYSKLRKVALMVVAHKSTSDEIGILRKAFQKYDKLHTGQVGYDQFKSAMCHAGMSDIDMKKIFDAVVSLCRYPTSIDTFLRIYILIFDSNV